VDTTHCVHLGGGAGADARRLRFVDRLPLPQTRRTGRHERATDQTGARRQLGEHRPEVRPSASKNPDGTLKPFYLKREFKYLAGDRFELNIVNSADPNGAVPIARISLRGHMMWRGPHPIAAGAQKVDFVADEGYEVTPLIQGFADLLNQVAANGYAKWQVNGTQSVFGKAFVPFGLSEGKNFMEFDLVYLSHDMLFWGARNVDGRGFDKEENRPTNLQIPLARMQAGESR